MQKNKTIKITQIAIFTAIATVVSLLDFPLPFFPSFYKLNLSDAVVLIGGFSLGALEGVVIVFLRMILSFLIKGTSTFFIGDFANCILSIFFVLPSFIIYKKNRTLKGAIIGMTVGIFSLLLFSVILNYFVLITLYLMVLMIPVKNLLSLFHVNSLFEFILFFVLPFNLLKGVVCSFIALITYKRLSKFINKISSKSFSH